MQIGERPLLVCVLTPFEGSGCFLVRFLFVDTLEKQTTPGRHKQSQIPQPLAPRHVSCRRHSIRQKIDT